MLIIATALVTLVPPMLSGAMQTAQFKATARHMVSGLHYARSVAIAQNREAVLTLNLEERFMAVSGRNRRFEIPEAVEVSLTTAETETQRGNVGSIRYFPDGSSTGGRIVLTTAEREMHIDVNWLTGRVTVDGA